MIRGLESLLLSSANAKKLADYYKGLGFKVEKQGEIGDKGEELYELKMKSGSGIYIADHSKIKGKNNQPERIIFNIEVDNIEKEVKRLKAKKIKPIQDIYHMEGYGLISTFKDIDGNLFQIVQVKAS
jgi:predicted enzyme related to lactoylglutathione lyase